jgi:hypothetical protein
MEIMVVKVLCVIEGYKKYENQNLVTTIRGFGASEGFGPPW